MCAYFMDGTLRESMLNNIKMRRKLHHGLLIHITQYRVVKVTPSENYSEVSTLTGQCDEKSK